MTVTVRPGYCTKTTAMVGVFSTSSGSCTFTCGDFRDTQDLLPFPVVNPICYYYHFEATGLAEFTQHSIRAVVGGVSGVGKCFTSPSDTDDFALYFSSCDNNMMHGGHVSGFHNAIKDYAENGALPLVGLIHVDDIGYVDGIRADDSGVDGVGIVNPDMALNPPQHTVENDRDIAYTAAYMACAGLMTSEDLNGYDSIYMWQKKWGRDEYRHWNQENINIFPQWGDHEFKNDMGFSGLATNDATGSPSNADIYASGKAAWNVFYGGIQPPVFNAANGNGWGFELGCAHISALDNVTNASGGYLDATTALTSYLGTNQITDFLTAISSAKKPFNIHGMQHGLRYLNDSALIVGADKVYNKGGAQHPLANHQPTEYSRMFTLSGQTPPSLMDSSWTNGINGVFIGLHGDYHRAKVEHHHRPAYALNEAENFHDFTMGTMNGSVNFGLTTVDAAGDNLWESIHAGLSVPLTDATFPTETTTVEWFGQPWNTSYLEPRQHGSSDNGIPDTIQAALSDVLPQVNSISGEAYSWTNSIFPQYWGCRIEIYGSRFPKEMHVVMLGHATPDDMILDGFSSSIGALASDNANMKNVWSSTHADSDHEVRNTKPTRNASVLWRKKFVQGRGGNWAFEVDDDISGKGSRSGGDE